MTTYDFLNTGLTQPFKARRTFFGGAQIRKASLTGAIQRVVRGGGYFEYEMFWRNLYDGQDRRAVLAFFARLNGGEHRVLLPEYGQASRGAFGGTPLVAGAGQQGNTIDVDGVGTVTDWIKSGDIFAVDGAHKVCTADASSSGGSITIDFVPRLRDSPANNASVLAGNGRKGTYILKTPVAYSVSAKHLEHDGGSVSNLSLTFIDSFPDTAA